ncbi:MAG: alpha/beta fold hydrolase [Gammaproteobacteria bacterium]|nr:alpha/beta fold hydrolase [Gammaproteobacteria bacterium]
MKPALIIVLVLLLCLAAVAAWLWTPDKPREQLESRYAAAPDDFLEVDGTRLHIRDRGPRHGPAVLLLHGFGASLHTWEPWADALASELRVISLDLPGAGLSAADPAADYSDERSIQILLALLDQLQLARASLVGNSLGGRIAWRFAAAHPERVERLVLISPDGFASPGFEYGKAPEVPAALGLLRFALPKSVLRMNLKVAYADPKQLQDAQVRRYHDLLLAPGNRVAMLQRMAQVVLVQPEPLLARIEAPTLLLWGERDAMIPFSNAADYLSALPDARLLSFADLGHVPHEEAPERTLEPVRSFLIGD